MAKIDYRSTCRLLQEQIKCGQLRKGDFITGLSVADSLGISVRIAFRALATLANGGVLLKTAFGYRVLDGAAPVVEPRWWRAIRGWPDTSERKRIIANRLREARKLAGLTQGQVAKKVNLHRSMVAEIETGIRSVSTQELTRFADLYDVNLSWLAGEGAVKFDPHDDQVQLAFRELEKLKPEDLDKLLRALAAIRGQGEEQ